jgi:hypothetical protein
MPVKKKKFETPCQGCKVDRMAGFTGPEEWMKKPANNSQSKSNDQATLGINPVPPSNMNE